MFNGQKKGKRAKLSGPAAPSGPVPTHRLPLIVYSASSDASLKKLLSEYGLSTIGSRSTLIDRHKAFVHAHNAELDSSTPRSIAAIIKQVAEEERQRGLAGAPFKRLTQQPAGASPSSDTLTAGFAALTQSLRARMAQEKKGGPSVWRCVLSTVAGRPFYYNTTTGIGQFDPPDDEYSGTVEEGGNSAALATGLWV